jgi:hypothetical protein
MASPFSSTAPPPPSPRTVRRQRRRQRRQRDQRVVAVVVVASAVLAALSTAQPTGTAWADALWCAALGAGVAWAGSRSRRWAWLWCSGIAAAFSIGTWWWMFGVAALAAALAGVFLDNRGRVLGATVGALAAQALLRFPAQGFDGLPSLLALFAVVPLFGSAYERSTMAVRRRVRRGLLVVGGLAVVFTAALGVAALLAKKDLDAAVSNSRSGLELIRDGKQTEAAGRLADGGLEFDAAHRLLGASWTWPAELVPVVAQHRVALASASASGSLIAHTGAVAASTAPYQQLRAANGSVDLATVRSMQQPVADTANALLSAQHTLDRVRSPWLLAPVGDPLEDFTSQVDQALPEAQLARDALAIAPRMLGADGDRTYLVLFTNPAESRFLGGFSGSYGLLVAHRGKVHFTVGDRISQLFTGPRAQQLKITGLDQYHTRYDRYEPDRNYQNLTVSPDMPTDAEVVRQLYREYYGKNLDGVFVVDPYALASLLELTGPVSVQGLSAPLTSANTAQYLIHQQYVLYGNEHDDRKDILSAAGKATFKALTTRRLPGPREIGAALSPMVAQQRLLFYPFAAEDQPLFRRMGTLGAFEPDPGSDFLSVRTANGNANKIDWYLTRSISDVVHYDPANGYVDATVTIRLHNSAPSSGLPEYLIGNFLDPSNGGDVPVGTNMMYLSIYTPLFERSATIDGQAAGVEAQPELGANVYSQLVSVPSGGTLTMVVHLEGVISAGSTYHLQLLNQPLVNYDHIHVEAATSSPSWHVTSSNGMDPATRSAEVAGIAMTDERYSVTFGS